MTTAQRKPTAKPAPVKVQAQPVKVQAVTDDDRGSGRKRPREEWEQQPRAISETFDGYSID